MGSLAQATPQPNHAVSQKLPPVGSFAPPTSASKDSKKRPRNDKPTTVVIVPNMSDSTGPSGQRVISGPVGTSNKRPKLNHKPLAADLPSIEPTLTPVLPEPLPPAPDSNCSPDELGFFDKVKKHISNRTTMVEFLKLCNMFSQNLIDANDLVHKASHFIGGNPELFKWFKDFMGCEGIDETIENRPRPPTEKVSLSNCRSVGPSYRLLPRKVSQKQVRLEPMRHELTNMTGETEAVQRPR